jgi:5-methylcytosine-specific restriction endonuclease McrA
MKKHVKIYLDHFGYVEQDIIPSELSGKPAEAIHHIRLKSQMGKDEIENLMALTIDEHDQAHFKLKPYLKREKLQKKHLEFMNNY